MAFPTETVYGLGADALNPEAVARIFEAKNRPFFDPVIVHIASKSDMKMIAAAVDEKARALSEKFWPGPLTIIFPKTGLVPDIVTAGLSTVAVRMPDNDTALELIRESGMPIAAPSANPFGYVSPTSAAHVYDQLKGRIDMILDGGDCVVGVESTIISTGDPSYILRYGGVPVEDIEKVIGAVERKSDGGPDIESPGRLPFHYSPGTPLVLVDGAGQIAAADKGNSGLLAFMPPADKMSFRAVEVLSSTGSMAEAAANLFSCLRRLDSLGLDVIYAEAVPEHNLGRAIMERLRKASSRQPSGV